MVDRSPVSRRIAEGRGRAVTHQGLVGYLGWVLPQVAIIDALGLNDYVIARNEATRAEQSDRPERQMAHDREAPEGYVECFRPNVVLENNYMWRLFL